MKQQITKLSNGLTVITEERSTGFLGVNIIFTAAAKDDGKQPGLAHFVEHLVAGYNKEDNKPLRLSLAIAKGSSNASTSYAETKYVATSLTSHADFPESPDRNQQILKALLAALTADMTGKNISEADVERERGAILAEFGQINDERRRNDSFDALVFPEHNSNIIGTQESVSQISLQDVRVFISRFYNKQNATVVVVGQDIDHAQICQLAEEALEVLPNGEKIDRPARSFSAGYEKHTVTPKPEKTLDCIFGYAPAPELSLTEQKICSDILGSLLMSKLRYEGRVVYSASATAHKSVIEISTGGLSANSPKFVNGIASTIKRYSEELITDIELQEIKLQIAANAQKAQESSDTYNRSMNLEPEQRLGLAIDDYNRAFAGFNPEKFRQFMQHIANSAPAVHVWGQDTELFPDYESVMKTLGQTPRELDANGRVILTNAEKLERNRAQKSGGDLPSH